VRARAARGRPGQRAAPVASARGGLWRPAGAAQGSGAPGIMGLGVPESHRHTLQCRVHCDLHRCMPRPGMPCNVRRLLFASSGKGCTCKRCTQGDSRAANRAATRVSRPAARALVPMTGAWPLIGRRARPLARRTRPCASTRSGWRWRLRPRASSRGGRRSACASAWSRCACGAPAASSCLHFAQPHMDQCTLKEQSERCVGGVGWLSRRLLAGATLSHQHRVTVGTFAVDMGSCRMRPGPGGLR